MCQKRSQKDPGVMEFIDILNNSRKEHVTGLSETHVGASRGDNVFRQKYRRRSYGDQVHRAGGYEG
jgi:hypothetical protein